MFWFRNKSSKGFSYRKKGKTIEVLPPEGETTIKKRNKFGFHLQKITGKIVGIGSIVLICAVINVIFVGAQKLYHSKDQAKLDDIKTVLATENSKIKSIELTLYNIESTLSNLKQEIDSTEAQYPNGIPHSIYKGYSQNIDVYNSLVTRYNNFYNQYTRSINEYNKKVGRG